MKSGAEAAEPLGEGIEPTGTGRLADPPMVTPLRGKRRATPSRASISATQEPKPTVYVVDDSPALRKSLRWLLKSAGLAAETYGSAREFLDAYDPTKPGCLVLDVRLQQMSGLDLQAELTARRVPTPIIIITAYGDVPTAVRALRGGAVDYIQKPFSDQLLLDRIWQAIERDRETRRAEVIRAEVAQRVARLTPREREVMGGLVAGKTSKEIGVELHLSARTVEAHRAQVLAKMEVDSGTKLVRLVLVAGSPGGEAPFDSTSNCVPSLPSITWNR